MITLTPNTKENIQEFLEDHDEIVCDPVQRNKDYELHRYTKNHNLNVEGKNREHGVVTPMGGETVALIVTDRNTGEAVEVNCEEWVLKASTHSMH